MTKEKIELEIKGIDNELSQYEDTLKIIKDLKAKKKVLAVKLDKMDTATLSFIDKFDKWKKGKGGKKGGWIPDISSYPKLRKLTDDMDLDKYEIYVMKDKDSWFWERLDIMVELDSETKNKSFSELLRYLNKLNETMEEESEGYNEGLMGLIWNGDLIEWLEAANEVMKKDLHSFKNDW